jgi:hypothetical protein
MKNDVIWRVAFLGILGVLGAMAITKLAPRANTEEDFSQFQDFFQIGSLVDLW